ncbi:MAG: hypothetical protein PVG45_03515 [Gammaproteobacteria bacterium]|jgi:hypothetical protein
MRDTTIDLARLDGGEIKDNGDRGYLRLSGQQCLCFSDLQFMLQGRPLSRLFSYGICYAEDSDEGYLHRFDPTS